MSQIETMDAATLYALLQRNEALIVDVREPDEYCQWRIPQAMLMPLGEIEQHISHIADDQRIIVFQCLKGKRASMAAQQIVSALPTKARIAHLEGGIESWDDAGFPVIGSDEDAETNTIPIMRQLLIAAGGIIAISSLSAMLGFSLGAFIAFMMAGGLVFAGTTGNCGLATVLQRMPWNKN